MSECVLAWIPYEISLYNEDRLQSKNDISCRRFLSSNSCPSFHGSQLHIPFKLTSPLDSIPSHESMSFSFLLFFYEKTFLKNIDHTKSALPSTDLQRFAKFLKRDETLSTCQGNFVRQIFRVDTNFLFLQALLFLFCLFDKWTEMKVVCDVIIVGL